MTRWKHERPREDGTFWYKVRRNARPRRIVLSLIRGRLATMCWHVGWWKLIRRAGK